MMIQALRKLKIRYEINTIEYENFLVGLISAMVCFLCVIVNYIYFSFYYEIQNQIVNINSLFLFVFGLAYLEVLVIKAKETTRKSILDFLTILLTIFLVFRYYTLIGPTVWTYSFIIVLVSLIREDIRSLLYIGVILTILGLYVWKYDIQFPLDNSYYFSQFIAYITLFLVAFTICLNNIRKNNKIMSQYGKLKQISEELNGSEKKFKSIVNALPDIVFILSKEGVFLDCETGDESNLLMKKDDFIGKDMDLILPEEISKKGKEKIQLTLETNQLQSMEYSLDMPEGKVYFEIRFVKSTEDIVFAILRDITESKIKQQQIEYLSYHDQLTGCFNRRYFEEELIRCDKEENYPLTLSMIDVNGLKLTNDAFGHNVGDDLLKKIAHIFMEEIKHSDVIARIGGDEFVVIHRNTSYEDAHQMMNQITGKITAEEIENLVLSVSVGYDTKVEAGQDLRNVFLKAEENMYTKKITESQIMRNKTIIKIIESLHKKVDREEFHSEEVIRISKQIGLKMDFNKEELREVEITGMLHDIGKIAINEAILNKKEGLLETEYNEIKRHPEVSYQILKSVDMYMSIAEYALAHHERWDGKGYPRSIMGRDIPLISRIIAVAEAYETMIHDKSYRNAISKKEAVEELKRNAGTQFDPEVVEVLVALYESERV